MVIACLVTAFVSMFCVFVTAPHSCGALFFIPGALNKKYY